VFWLKRLEHESLFALHVRAETTLKFRPQSAQSRQVAGPRRFKQEQVLVLNHSMVGKKALRDGSAVRSVVRRHAETKALVVPTGFGLSKLSYRTVSGCVNSRTVTSP